MTLLGHLQLVEVFKRAFKRGSFKLALSQGFHPSPQLSFLSALPLGVPSLDELFLFSLTDDKDPKEISLELPSGLNLLSLERHPKGLPRLIVKANLWKVTSPLPLWNSPPLFPGAQVGYTNSKGIAKSYSLTKFVKKVDILDPQDLLLEILVDPGGSPKPLLCARALWGLADDVPLELEKLKTII
jgi:radical SAM-linked protein